MQIDNKMARYMEMRILHLQSNELTDGAEGMLLDALDYVWIQLSVDQILYLDGIMID